MQVYKIMRTKKLSKAKKVYKMIYKGRIYTGYNKDLLRDMILKLKWQA